MNRLPQNRTFGIFVAIIIGVAAFRFDPPKLWAAASGLCLLFAIFIPNIFYSLNVLWSKLGDLLGRILSPIILRAVYYLILTPMVLVIKATGHRAFSPPGWIARTKKCNFEKPF